MDFLTIVFFILSTYIFLYFFIYDKKARRIAKEINKIPGPRSFPFIGTSAKLAVLPRKDIFNYTLEQSAQYKPIYRLWVGSKPRVCIMKAEYVEVVMNNLIHIEKGLMYKFLQPWLGHGLITSFGERWHKHRKLITPAFHFKILENSFQIFTDKSTKLVEQLGGKANGQPFNIDPLLTGCTLDIICETAMGVEVNAMDDSANSEYVSAIYGLCENVVKRAVVPWLHNDYIFNNFSAVGKAFNNYVKILHGFTNKVIQERKENFKQNALKPQLSEEDLLLGKKKRMAFLDLLIEASNDGKTLTDNDIREEVDTFMFAGHDSTTTSISWNLWMLGHYPKIQEKVAEELQEIFGDDEDRNIIWEDLSKMKYLERVIKESLRLYPVVPLISRRLASDIQIDKYTIPKGVEVAIYIYDVHRDPEQFPDPEVFNPDNFLPEKCQKRHPYAYIPFSAGPRNCIGQKFAIMEEKIVLASILRKFKIHSVGKRNEVKTVSEIVMRPHNQLLVRLENRN